MIIQDNTIWIMIGLIIASTFIDALMYLKDRKQFPIFSIVTIILIAITAVMVNK